MLKPEQFSVFLLAAGNGERMDNQAKISVKLAGKSLLEHCLITLQQLNCPISVAIPAQPAMLADLKSELKKNQIIDDNIHWQTGGLSRQESVKLLLDSTEREFIFLHEVARPFIAFSTCEQLVALFNPNQDDALTLCQPLPPRDMLVEVKDDQVSKAIDTNKVMQQQTPQIYRRSALVAAYNKTSSVFPSTSLLMLNAGYQVKYLTHHGKNLKITYPEDLC